MFYENLIEVGHFKTKEKNIDTFKNSMNTDTYEDCLKSMSGKVMYNFDISSGVLKDGMGIGDVTFKYGEQMFRKTKKVNFPENYQIMACWHFPYFDTIANEDCPALIVYCSNRKFYFLFIQHQDTDMLEIPNLTFQDVPMAVCSKINGIDTLILVSKSDGMYTWNPINGTHKIDAAPEITSMCSQYDRLFVTCGDDKKSILYSESLNPTNFNTSDNEGGIISLNDDFGYCNKVISFKGYVYIFRDYNIARITAYGDDDEFVVSQMHVSNGKIFPGTICACGDKIIYLASDGLYSFDGGKSTKIELNINNLLSGNENELASGNYSNGCYYVACRMNFDDGDIEGCESLTYVNNALLKYNLSNGEISIMRGYDIQNITVINDSIDSYVLVVFHNGVGLRVGMLDMSGMYFNTPTHKVWISAKTDFNYPTKTKVIKEISFQSATDGVIKIWCDDRVKEFDFTGKNGVQKIKPLMKGKRFGFAFHVTANNSKIVKPTIKVGVLC